MSNGYKMIVTPAESQKVQQKMFKMGYPWCSGIRKVQHTQHPYLFIHPMPRGHSFAFGIGYEEKDDKGTDIFNRTPSTLITPKEFLNMEKI